MRTLLPLLLALPACADQVILNNGDRITGKVVRKEAATLDIKSDLFGDVTVKWKDVASLKTDNPVTVVLPDNRRVQGPVATEGGKLVVQGGGEAPLADIAALRDAAAQRRYERMLQPPLLDLWAGYVDFSIASAQGNARTLTTAIAGNATRATGADKVVLRFNQIYARGLVGAAVVDTASAVRGGWLYDRNLGKRAFLNLFNDYEFDRFQSLDLRTVAGGGAGYSAYKGDRGALGFVGGGAWNRESFSRPVRASGEFVRNSAEAYWGNDLVFRLNGISTLKESFRMFNNLTNGGEYRANLDVGIDTKIWKMLAWQVSASNRYITNPAPGRKTNDLLISSGLRFSFARLP